MALYDRKNWTKKAVGVSLRNVESNVAVSVWSEIPVTLRGRYDRVFTCKKVTNSFARRNPP
jgi:hypothetical protein